jgi:hypothetical protein
MESTHDITEGDDNRMDTTVQLPDSDNESKFSGKRKGNKTTTNSQGKRKASTNMNSDYKTPRGVANSTLDHMTDDY